MEWTVVIQIYTQTWNQSLFLQPKKVCEMEVNLNWTNIKLWVCWMLLLTQWKLPSHCIMTATDQDTDQDTAPHT